MRRRLLAVIVLAALWSACGKGPPAGPSQTPGTSGSLTISGTVNAPGGPVAGARVDIVSGANAGVGANADGAGRFSIANLDAGALTLRVSALGFVPQSLNVTLTGNLTNDFTLAAASFFTNGRVLDAVTQSGVGGVSIAGDGVSGSTDLTGAFSLIAAAGAPGPRLVTVTAPGRVDRLTNIRVPGSDILVSLISTGFDLRAFDEMFRVPHLLRWTAAPPLRIETRTLQFTNINMTSAVGTADLMSSDELGALAGDLGWALPQLTGGTFAEFASVVSQTSTEGGSVPLLNSGVITVARVAGLTQGSTFWGYSRWQFRSDGTVIAGLIMLDRDFERSGSVFRRSLRAHELGHALGYNHVTLRTSVMNSNARTEPNGFDLDACRVAFQRPPGNRSPDSDPDSASLNRVNQIAIWSPPIR